MSDQAFPCDTGTAVTEETTRIQRKRKASFSIEEDPDVAWTPPRRPLRNVCSEPAPTDGSDCTLGKGSDSIPEGGSLCSTRDFFELLDSVSEKESDSIRDCQILSDSIPDKGSDSVPDQLIDSKGRTTRTSSTSRAVGVSQKSTARQFVYSEDSGSHVTAMCPLSHSRVWIAYRPTLVSETFSLKLFDAEGQVLTTAQNEGWSSGLFSVASGITLTWCFGKNSIQLVTPDGTLTTHDQGTDVKNIVSCASKDDHGLIVVDDKLRRVKCMYAKNDDETDSPESCDGDSDPNSPGTGDPDPDSLETTDRESDPESRGQLANQLKYSEQEVIMDKPPSDGRLVHGYGEGRYFAFINDDDHHSSVNVYAKSGTRLTRHLSSYTLDSHILDARFCQIHGRDVLLVIVLKDNQVHVVDPTDNCRFVRYLETGTLHLDRPHRLATDHDQHVWIGCWGGKVVMVDL